MTLIPTESLAASYESILANARARGIKPESQVTCVPSAGSRGATRGIKGCVGENKCIFKYRKFGGFKGLGPRNVGYYLKPNDGTAHQKEDFMPCFRFIHTMLERMRSGERDRQNGKPGEMVSIVAQEGETIHVKWHGPVNEADKSLIAPYKRFVAKVVVPKYEHETEVTGDDYEQELERRQRAREVADPDMAIGLPEEAPRVDATSEAEESEDWAETLGSEPAALAPSGDKKAK